MTGEQAPLLETCPVHLGKGGTAVPQPEFPRDEQAMQWFMDYAARHDGDGEDGRLVSHFRFIESWAGWEMHPGGAEVVVCTEGTMTLIQDIDGEERRTTLTPGQYAINPPGVWHTGDIEGTAAALFITSGWGTESRPR